MNKVLKDSLEVKKKENGNFPWSYKAPSYDNRTSCSLSAGNDYGVGRRVPTGLDKASDVKSGPVPQESHCFSPKDIFRGEDKAG